MYEHSIVRTLENMVAAASKELKQGKNDKISSGQNPK